MGALPAPVRVAEFRRLLMEGALNPLVADGAMGTMLLDKLNHAGGTSLQRCLDELNLSLAALVRDVHREYARAGARILGTNTFGANRKRLGLFGFGEKVRAINQAGVRIAREAASCSRETGPAFVAGTVGPLGVRLEPFGPTTLEQARAVFREQIAALVESGVDLLMLETFQDLGELREAILAAREAAGSEMIVAAHLSVEDDGTLASGASTREFTRLLNEWPVDVIGLNCSSGPTAILETIEAMAPWTSKPLSARPNAGLPSVVDGRNFYSCSPPYMGQYARQFVRAGARIVGGCCGATPEHIREILAAIHEAQPRRREENTTVRVEEPMAPPEALPDVLDAPGPVPMAGRTGLGAKLAAGSFVVTVEMAPPKGPDASSEIEVALRSKRAGIDCIMVSDGPRAGVRMSAPALCQLLQQQAGMECALHLCCRGRSLGELQSALLGAHVLGIRNLIGVTGDPPHRRGINPGDASGFDVDSAGLTAMAARLNRGLDLGGHPLGSRTSLLLGVTANPGAPDLDHELRRFEAKVKAGAEFAVTQPVFDLDLLERFLKRIEGYKLPLIAGIRPLTSLRNAEFTIHELRTRVPLEFMARMRSAGTGEEARAEGVAIACEMAKRARALVAGVQVSAPFGSLPMAIDVAEAIGTRA